ncbi:MAG: hypothetical protein HC848_03880 [Limnobacter sp.]|nr:hypothetical protein [Limnobacter sp.]
MRDLQQANGLTQRSYIRAGMSLSIPDFASDTDWKS